MSVALLDPLDPAAWPAHAEPQRRYFRPALFPAIVPRTAVTAESCGTPSSVWATVGGRPWNDSSVMM